ncbi:unnamed protein product [Rotaria sp. Silwood1]|nr:unnamed protein product [Rotaria sp. Silwood1]
MVQYSSVPVENIFRQNFANNRFYYRLVNGSFDVQKQPVVPYNKLVIITQFSLDNTSIRVNITYICSIFDYSDLEFAFETLSPTLAAMQMEPLRQTLAAHLYNPNNTDPIEYSNKGLCPENVSLCYPDYIHHNVTYGRPEKVLSRYARSADLPEQAEITSDINGSDLIINDRYIITAAHIFNPLIEKEDVLVPYKHIEFTSLSYASDQLFNTDNTNIFEAKIIIRGINGIGLQPHEICLNYDDDVATLSICRYEQIKDVLMSENKKAFCPTRLLDRAELEPNSSLFLLAYCSTIRTKNDVEFYEECPGYSLYTREHLNSSMHPNHRTVSIGKCIANDDIHIVHDCPSLCGASDGCIFDADGRLVGVHTGVCDGDVHYNVNGERRL